jgi:NarL family two-component system sensor histidine kinase LiaS
MKIILLFLCFLANAGFSQIHRIDSLKRELAIVVRQPDGYSKDTLHCYTLKAIMKSYDNINFDSSFHYNALMINLSAKKKLHKELIYAYQYGGYLSQIKGDHHQSIRFHYKALLLAEKLNQFTRIAFSQGALAHAYTSLKFYPKATSLCQQGLAILLKNPDTDIQLSILNVLGSIHREQGHLGDALKVNTRLYKLARAENDPWYEAYGLHAVGRVLNDMGETGRAMEFYQKALALSQKTGSVELEGNILLNTTDLYIKQKKWKQAYKHCLLAKQMAISIKNGSIVMEAEQKLSEIFKNTGQPVKALRAYENFAILKENLSKEKNQQQIEALHAQYDNVQKTNALQKERVKRLAGELRNQQLGKTTNNLSLGILTIVFLAAILFWNNRNLQAKNHEIDCQRALLETARKELAEINKILELRVDQRTEDLLTANRELIRKNEEIKQALFKGQTIERKRVALELHDNLSSLLSAVNMTIQSINPEYLSESQQSIYQNLKHLIQNAYAEVRNISHNILPAELEKEGLATTLTTLVRQLNQNSPLQFSLSIINLHERLPVEIEFNVYSIVWELINNAIKHSHATTVSINLLRTACELNLMVNDNGVGIKKNNEKRGIGLQNILTRLESLGGTFDTPLGVEKGTHIHIKIPIDTVSINGNFLVVENGN